MARDILDRRSVEHYLPTIPQSLDVRLSRTHSLTSFRHDWTTPRSLVLPLPLDTRTPFPREPQLAPSQSVSQRATNIASLKPGHKTDESWLAQ
jgi:hypothetical protein